MLAARVLPGLLLGACAIVACTGTSSVDIPSTTTDTAPNEPAAEDAIPTGSATAAAPPDAGVAIDAGPPVPVCAPEVEPNDAAGDASPLAASPAAGPVACLSGALATTRDRDYFTVTAPADATSLVLGHTESGPIAYRVYEDTAFGNLFATSFTAESPPIPVTGGARYLIRLTASGAAPPGPRTYQLTATFD